MQQDAFALAVRALARANRAAADALDAAADHAEARVPNESSAALFETLGAFAKRLQGVTAPRCDTACPGASRYRR